ncbi:MAG: PH domain-containing protein, partial [Chthoniobacteraceae bacterium]
MYKTFRDFAERLLRIPHDPTPPPGDEHCARVFRAAPAYLKYRTVLWAIGVAFSFFFGVVFLGGLNIALMSDRSVPGFVRAIVFTLSAFVFLLIVLRAVFAFAVLRLDFEKRWYVVTDRSLRIREGVINVREMTVMFANIQNVSVMQGPIQRPLGIADLQVETAGGGGAHANQKQLGPNLHTAWFRGIDNAEEVKQLIQARLRALKDSGLGHHEEMPHPAAPAPAFLDALRAVHTEA